MTLTKPMTTHAEYMVNQAIDLLDATDPMDGSSAYAIRASARYLRAALAPEPKPIPREAIT